MRIEYRCRGETHADSVARPQDDERLRFDLLAWGQMEIVVSKQLTENHQDLQHGIVAADAAARAASEGEISEGRVELLVRFGETLRVEVVGIFPVAWGVVRSVDVDDDRRTAGDRDIPDGVVGDSHAIDHPEWRVETESFLNDLGGELEFRDVAKRERRIAKHGI